MEVWINFEKLLNSPSEDTIPLLRSRAIFDELHRAGYIIKVYVTNCDISFAEKYLQHNNLPAHSVTSSMFKKDSYGHIGSKIEVRGDLKDCRRFIQDLCWATAGEE